MRRRSGLTGRPIADPDFNGANGSRHGHGADGVTSPEAADLRRLYEAAEERGFNDGLARGEAELGEAIAAARALLDRLEADAPTQRAVLGGWVTAMSLGIARRIIGDAVRADETVLLGIVERAIASADASPDVRILVHPRAVARLREAWEAAHGPAYLGKRWTFGGDPTLPPTGCLVRYQHGLVDAGIDAQLEAVGAALDAALEDGEFDGCDRGRRVIERFLDAVDRAPLLHPHGEVVRVIGTTVEAAGLVVQVGSICWIDIDPTLSVSAEVVGFRDGRITLVPFGELSGIRSGSRVRLREEQFRVPVGTPVLGRVLDGFGRPMDGKGPLFARQRVIGSAPPRPLDRARVVDPLPTGVRALDGLLTTGRGQRLGIFAGSGVGQIDPPVDDCPPCRVDVNVIALIGERGREVRDFVEEQLGPDGLARSVVVVATSDQPALLRKKAAEVATTIAEAFRDDGKHVLFLMDSVTRLAMAQREIGLGAGEPPALRGYPPSVFSYLPKLLERTGSGEFGTITGFYTVLVEGDDMNEPVADTVRSILDGHVVLSRALAERNHFPAIDILASVSRVMPALVPPEHLRLAGAMRASLAEYEGARDLIEVGAYAPGSSRAIDAAIAERPAIDAYLRQTPEETGTIETAFAALAATGVGGALSGAVA